MDKENILTKIIKSILLKRFERKRYWSKWECKIMNFFDRRYSRCECHYQVPYGLVIMSGCYKHD